ncbi:unnamed protein product [Rotaria sp. Silwood1]|nr:unnamed protein product [Rotaria sp. Silwood1]
MLYIVSRRKILPLNHADTCETYEHHANFHEIFGKIDAALDYYNKCLNIDRLHTVYENHPTVALTYSNLAVVHERRRKFSEALEYYQKRLDITYKILPTMGPKVQRTENNLKCLRLEMENQ